MNINKVDFKNKYITHAAIMMSKAWTYHKNFKGCTDIVFYYEQFFKSCYCKATYSEFLVDENDILIGFLISSSPNEKHFLASTHTLISNLFYLLIGKFGERISGLKTFLAMTKDIDEIMKDSHLYDEELSLFFVDESARGLKLGKKLLNNYLDYCKNNNINTIILLTDAECDYKFYDHNGFTRVNELNSKYFANPELPANGFAYSYTINKKETI